MNGVAAPALAACGLLALAAMPGAARSQAAHEHDAGHSAHGDHDGMAVSRTGVVMNANTDVLPRGCEAVSRRHEFVVRAGSAYATLPGAIFGMSEHEWRVEPCSLVTVTFVNEDEVRHQWMVHGLPRYLYPAGMFHIEAMGGQAQTGAFIVPSEHRNYLVHCDMAQHMEKGMRGQLIVGDGGGDLWGVTGITDPFHRQAYLPESTVGWALGLVAGAFLASLILLRYR